MAAQHNENKIHSASKFGKFQDYIGEFVYGGIDGSVTTFAVVAGATGAELSSSVVIILGFANLIADGFAMSVGSYLSTKSEKQNYEKHKAIEYWEIENLREREVEEVREIYENYGFKGKLLEDIVAHITSDKDRWVEVMMKEELEMQEEAKTPLGMGAATFAAFIIMGFIPLIVYIYDYLAETTSNLFMTSSIMTGLTFMGIGFLKSKVTGTSKIRGVIETLILGGAAAILSYFVGDWLEKLIAG
ncbi:MAG: VIT1/CCC1 transporter family protein [Bacteroidia bacterium]